MTPEQYELLIRMSEKQEMMYDLLSNHLQHHDAYALAFIGVGLILATTILGLTVGVIKLWLKNKALIKLSVAS